MFRRIAPTVALVALLLVPGSASAATPAVDINGNQRAFVPSTITISYGNGIAWNNNSSLHHTATADVLNLWDVDLPHNSSGGYTFERAGGFAYHCTIHGGMRGTVLVQMSSSDTTPVVGQMITITFAVNAAPSGFTEQIQKRKAGGTWKTYANSASTSVTWTPPAARTFQFRARLKRVSDGTFTGWSPILQMTVAP
ncbi:MAG: hypothetical protein QOJ81_2365 [Chloroflexota bacterium]|jgi:plastocyanin|nr:hypothetical protein [Chloroflexota bacterium]